jgi:hypothetical protein
MSHAHITEVYNHDEIKKGVCKNIQQKHIVWILSLSEYSKYQRALHRNGYQKRRQQIPKYFQDLIKYHLSFLLVELTICLIIISTAAKISPPTTAYPIIHNVLPGDSAICGAWVNAGKGTRSNMLNIDTPLSLICVIFVLLYCLSYPAILPILNIAPANNVKAAVVIPVILSGVAAALKN